MSTQNTKRTVKNERSKAKATTRRDVARRDIARRAAPQGASPHPSPSKSTVAPEREIELQFAAALGEAEYGDHDIPADGEFHSVDFPDDTPGKKKGSIKLTIDADGRIDGVVFDHRKGSKPVFVWNGKNGRTVKFTDEERAARAMAREHRDTVRRKEQAEQRAALNTLFNSSSHTKVAAHPYAIHKEITRVLGLRTIDKPPSSLWDGPVSSAFNNALMLPIKNARTDELMSIQFIASKPDANNKFAKLYPKGSEKKGGAIFLNGLPRTGKKGSAGTIVIAEGFATAHACMGAKLGCHAIAALDAGNLASVATAIKDRRIWVSIENNMIIAADDDQAKDKKRKDNPGIEGAVEAARAAGCKIAIPHHEGRRYNDFDDLRREEGDEAVEHALDNPFTPDEVEKKFNLKVKVEAEAEADPQRPSFDDAGYDPGGDRDYDPGDEAEVSGTAEGPPPIISATRFEWIEPENIAKRQWLYAPYYIRQFVSLIVATGGVGKSSLIVAEMLAMASGQRLLGIMPSKALKVWYWNGEDPYDELQRRIMGAAKFFELERDDIGDRLYVNSGRTTEIQIARSKRGDVEVVEPVVDAMIKTITDEGIDIVIIDPFVSCHSVSDESDNAGIEKVVRAWTHIAEATNCAVMLVHHSRKTGKNDADVESARGASSLLAKARSARALNKMSMKEAEDAGIDEFERQLYFRSDHGKSSMTRPAEEVDWYKLEDIDLGNDGELFGAEGDHVGVATRWGYPKIEVPKFSAANVRTAQDAIEKGGPWRAHFNANDWVGIPIALALGLDTDNAKQKKQLKKLQTQWVAMDWLVVVTAKDKKGNDREFIEVGKRAEDTIAGASASPPYRGGDEE